MIDRQTHTHTDGWVETEEINPDRQINKKTTQTTTITTPGSVTHHKTANLARPRKLQVNRAGTQLRTSVCVCVQT